MMNPSVSVPPPIAPPKGLSGLFDDHDPNQILDTSKFGAGQVYLNVYDLGDSDTLRKINAVSTGNNNILIGGLFHAGVEVFGGEWCYGFTEDDRSGVSCIPPRTHPQHTYRTTVPLGVTTMKPSEVTEAMNKLAREWRGNQYNLIHNNCQNFCHAVSQELGVGKPPGWVDRAARTASSLDTTSKQVAEQARKVPQLVRTVTSTVEETVLSIIPPDETSLERATTEVVENVRRGSIQALDIASVKAQEIGNVVQAQAEELGSVVQARTTELLGEDFERQVQQVGQEAQENIKLVASNIWQFGQDLQKAAGLDLTGLLGVGDAVAAPGEQQRRGSTGAAVREDVRCPQGHGLRPGLARRGTCDGCGANVQDGERVLDCRQCNWYLCGPCSQKALTIPKSFGGPTATSSAPPAMTKPAAAAAPAAAATAAAPVPAPAPAPAPAVDLLGDIEPPASSAPAKPSEPLDLLGDSLPGASAAPAPAPAAQVTAAVAGDDDDQE